MHILDAVVFMHILHTVIFVQMLDAFIFMQILHALIFMQILDAETFMHFLHAVIFMSSIDGPVSDRMHVDLYLSCGAKLLATQSYALDPVGLGPSEPKGRPLGPGPLGGSGAH